MSLQSLTFKRSKKSVSLTALIDVVFILLLFFMLTSTFTSWRSIDFSVTATSNKAPVVVDTPPQLFILDSQGTLTSRYSDLIITRNDDIARAISTLNPTETVFVSPKGDVNLQLIVSTLEALKALGLKVTLGPVVMPLDEMNATDVAKEKVAANAN